MKILRADKLQCGFILVIIWSICSKFPNTSFKIQLHKIVTKQAYCNANRMDLTTITKDKYEQGQEKKTDIITKCTILGSYGTTNSISDSMSWGSVGP